MEVEDWETSSAELSDTEANLKDTNEDLYYTPGSLPKLQFRSDISRLDGMMRWVWLRWWKRRANCGQQQELFAMARSTAQLRRFCTSENNGVIIDTELKDSAVVVESLSNLQVDELRPNFDIYLPNSKFRKTSPGDPAFLLCLIRGSPPSKAKFEALERQCGQAPLKFCHVDQGRVSIFSFKRVDLPVLP
ncbi:hypothetical protein GH714_025156 [Hevea brasiliensis]|uniref:Uncharacterized protein n=1 Tax=Hevea brasiliensis TaxID=3981 RepID=A0A6A6LPE1_HEVBR|nr:hypothetical protein GH714_025156 [Hevea brasiliensis]